MALPNLFNGPVPGQSFTEDPSSKPAYMQPPKFSTVNKSIDHLYRVITTEDFVHNFILVSKDDLLNLDVIVSGMLKDGFIRGLWSVDVMMLLVEPLTIMLVWLSAMVNVPVNFSNDTGLEDRTGFGDILDELGNGTAELPIKTPPINPQDPTAPEQPQSPLVAGPQSPLVAGGQNV